MQDVKREVLGLLPRLSLSPEDRLPGGATWEQIARLEASIDTPLPGQLVEWLSVCNGPNVCQGGVFGIRPDDLFLDIEDRWKALPDWCQGRCLPVAGDGCGNTYVLDLRGGSTDEPAVFFIDHEDEGVLTEPSYIVASDLWHFLRFLFRDDLGDKGWPCNREKVLAEDPKLATMQSVRFCWGG
jgi:hypothetical protein